MTYAKFLAALSSTLAVAGSVAADGTLSAPDWVAMLSSLVGALAVYAVPNKGRP